MSEEFEECDQSLFCDNSTCKCLKGHPKNNATGLCSGCGNGILDTNEECDGIPNCDNSTCKCLSMFVPGGRNGCVEIPIEDDPYSVYALLIFASWCVSVIAIVLFAVIVALRWFVEIQQLVFMMFYFK